MFILKIEFKQPDFSLMQPKKIDQANKKMEYKLKIINQGNEVKSSRQEFEISFRRLRQQELLNKFDIKNLLSYIDEVREKSKDAYYRFINYLEKNTDLIMPTTFSLMVQSIYKYDEMDTTALYAILRHILTSRFSELKENLQDKYNKFRNIAEKHSSSESFRNTISGIIKLRNDLNSIEITRREYYVDIDTRIFVDGVSNYIVSKYEDIKLFQEYVKPKLIDCISLDRSLIIFKKILSLMSNKNIILPRHWLIIIREKMGHPEEKGNSRWENLFKNRSENQSVKDKFREQINTIELYDFFEKISGDRDRLQFWKNYIPLIYRAECLKGVDSKPFVMEFANHTFIEFGKKGNALYYYPKKLMNIEEAQRRVKRHENNMGYKYEAQKAKELKDSSTGDSFAHSSDWQQKLQDKLSDFGYKSTHKAYSTNIVYERQENSVKSKATRRRKIYGRYM